MDPFGDVQKKVPPICPMPSTSQVISEMNDSYMERRMNFIFMMHTVQNL